jgi:long-subunit acyl-CoA synthetase (AMP-forming)
MAIKGNARKTYKTMRGKMVDMDQLEQRNELTPAVGNARVNARGDELGPGGKVVRKREDLMREYYETTNKVPDEPMPGAEVKVDEVPAPKAAKTTKTKAQQKVEEKGIQEDPKMAAEFDDQDWVEDADGNFIPKSEA